MTQSTSLNKNTLIRITFIILSLAIIGIFTFIVITALDIRSISNKIFQERQALELKYQTGLSLRDAVTDLEMIRDDIELLSNTFISKENTLSFIDDLESEADKHTIELTIAIPEITETKQTSGPIRLSMKGSSTNVLSFLSGLEAKPFYIVITSLKLQNQESATGNDRAFTGELIGTIYWK